MSLKDGAGKAPKGLEEKNLMGLLYMLTTVGLGVTLTIIGSFLAGLWLTKHLDLGYAPVIVMLVGGISISFIWVYKKCCTIMKIDCQERKQT
jgi:hypothetical protein